MLAACLLFSAVLLLSRVRPLASDISKTHNPGSRISVTESDRRRMSVSYDYDAVPNFDPGEGPQDSDEEALEHDEPLEDEEEGWRRQNGEQGGPSRDAV